MQLRWTAIVACLASACGDVGTSLPDAPVFDAPPADTSTEPVAGSLNGLRWELPCASDANEGNCNVIDPAPVVATLGGSAATTYQVTLRFRGVVETKTYDGGTTTGYFNEGGVGAGDGFNVYALTVSAPAPAAAMGDATPLYVIATPVLGSLSPSAISVIESSDVNSSNHYVPAGSGVIAVTANDLPANVIDLCSVAFEVCFSRACAPGHASAPVLSGTGFNFSVLGSQLTGPHDVVLRCGSVSSNKLSLTLVGPPP